MATYGQALRQARQHEASGARPCTCRHRCDSHRELPYGSPGYEPLSFACTECDCPNFTQQE